MVAVLDMSRKLDERLKRDIVKARPDPRLLGYAKPKHKQFVDNEHAPEGRRVLAYMVFVARKRVLDISFQRFADLVVEDRRRELILNDTPLEQIKSVENFHANTVMRIEDCFGIYGADPRFIALIAPRLADPDTGEAFTSKDLIAIAQSIEYINIERVKDPDYFALSRKINAQRDVELLY